LTHISVSRRVRRRIAALAGLLIALGAVGTAAADEYNEQWGPAIGSELPLLEAFDQAGKPRTLADLAGERGLLLFMSRSADW